MDLKEGFLGRQRHTAKQIAAKLREAVVLQGKGKSLEEFWADRDR